MADAANRGPYSKFSKTNKSLRYTPHTSSRRRPFRKLLGYPNDQTSDCNFHHRRPARRLRQRRGGAENCSGSVDPCGQNRWRQAWCHGCHRHQRYQAHRRTETTSATRRRPVGPGTETGRHHPHPGDAEEAQCRKASRGTCCSFGACCEEVTPSRWSSIKTPPGANRRGFLMLGMRNKAAPPSR